MAVNLFSIDQFPNRIGVSKLEEYVEDGVFFLDFSRQLKIIRTILGCQLPFGFATGMFVPVVHQGERHGGYIISVDISDPAFKLMQPLWRRHYPSPPVNPQEIVGDLKIIADFATQFPEDSQ